MISHSTEKRITVNKRKRKKKDKDREVNDLVLTPGGWRPKSSVHHIPPGYHIDFGRGRPKIVHTATGKVIKELGEIPQFGSGSVKSMKRGPTASRPGLRK